MSAAPPFERRLRPTAGVLRLVAEALVDLLLLAPRVLLAAAQAAARRRAIATLIHARAPHAA
ncbi:MAG: hypothetical protein FJ293_05415 [Planctomycetes bacterium]|nr:hypothetical protein [Planctomycetota bacterium]